MADKIAEILSALRNHIRVEQEYNLPSPYMILNERILVRSFYELDALYLAGERFIQIKNPSLEGKLPKLNPEQVLGVLRGEITPDSLVVKPAGNKLPFCSIEWRWVNGERLSNGKESSFADFTWGQVVMSQDLVSRMAEKYACSKEQAFEVIAAHEAGHLINHKESPEKGIDEYQAWATASLLIGRGRLFNRMCKDALATYGINPVEKTFSGLKHINFAHPCEWSLKRGILRRKV